MSEKITPCPFCKRQLKISQEPHDNGSVAGMYYVFHKEGRRDCRLEIYGHFFSEAQAELFIFTGGKSAQIPDDMRRLIIAARIVAFEDPDDENLKELGDASEAFADRIPWENDPEDEVRPSIERK